jgi:signal peptidase II
MTINKQKLLPLILAPVITIADQVSKIIVTTTMKPNQIVEVCGNFLRLWYRTNKHNIFGIGTGWPSGLQYLSFLILPLIVLGGALYIYFTYKDLSSKYRWLLATIMGAGLGNMIDRLFRPDGVVDFIDVNTYGILGLPPRWPTFNLADSALTISIILFVIFFIITEIRSRGEKRTR